MKITKMYCDKCDKEVNVLYTIYLEIPDEFGDRVTIEKEFCEECYDEYCKKLIQFAKDNLGYKNAELLEK